MYDTVVAYLFEQAQYDTDDVGDLQESVEPRCQPGVLGATGPRRPAP